MHTSRSRRGKLLTAFGLAIVSWLLAILIVAAGVAGATAMGLIHHG